MKKRLLAMVLSLSMCVCTLSGCAGKNEEKTPAGTAKAAAETKAESEESAQSAKEYNIVVMPKAVGLTYFEAARAGVEKADKEIDGVNAVFTGPTVADAAEQVKMIQDLISQGVDAICVSANDADSLTPVLKQAKEAGIKILDWDSPADPSVVDLSVKEIDYKTYAEANWDALVESMGEEGE